MSTDKAQPTKRAKKQAKLDDGKSAVQIRIDRQVLADARAMAKAGSTTLDDLAATGLVMLMGEDESQPEPTVSTEGLNPGTLLEAEAFCESRGWTLDYLINRALIKELDRAK